MKRARFALLRLLQLPESTSILIEKDDDLDFVWDQRPFKQMDEFLEVVNTGGADWVPWDLCDETKPGGTPPTMPLETKYILRDNGQIVKVTVYPPQEPPKCNSVSYKKRRNRWGRNRCGRI